MSWELAEGTMLLEWTYAFFLPWSCETWTGVTQGSPIVVLAGTRCMVPGLCVNLNFRSFSTDTS
eukprot:326135-Pelagomonas_calceolata.AAC.4